MLKKLGVLALLTLSFFSAEAIGAPDVVTTCNGCTALDSKNAATNAYYNVIGAGGYTYYVYVWDDTAQTMTQYEMLINQRQGGLVAHAIGTASSDITQAYQQAVTAVAQNGGSAVFNQRIGWTDPNYPAQDKQLNSYDFAQNSAAQNDISDWMVSYYGLSPGHTGPLSFIYQIFIGSSPYTVRLEIVLADGGIAVMYFDGAKFGLTEVTDAYNNQVPLSPDKVPGQYRGGVGDAGNGIGGYIRDRFGYNFSGVSTCVNYTLACTGGNSAVAPHCDIVRCN